jgi:hypothetical protein
MPTRKSDQRREVMSQELTPQEAAHALAGKIGALQEAPHNLPLIKVVGMSGSGKSTFVNRLRRAGYHARPVSQEHSEIADLWQQFDRPLVLIYLSLSLEAQKLRRADVNWTPEYYKIEEKRLEMARNHADLRIDTTHLTPDEVYNLAVAYLGKLNLRRAQVSLHPLPSTGSTSSRAQNTPTDPAETDSKT